MKGCGTVQQTQKLFRKQHLIYPSQVEKLRVLAEAENTSVSEMLRRAIDAFDPNTAADMSESELLELARIRVKEAIKDTIATRKRAEATLKEIAARHAKKRKVA
jgi:hypothetical protein